jgi:hypothetical protein
LARTEGESDDRRSAAALEALGLELLELRRLP